MRRFQRLRALATPVPTGIATPPAVRDTAVVTAVNGDGTLTVTYDGTAGVPCIDCTAGSAGVGDTVEVLKSGSVMQALPVAGYTPPTPPAAPAPLTAYGPLGAPTSGTWSSSGEALTGYIFKVAGTTDSTAKLAVTFPHAFATKVAAIIPIPNNVNSGGIMAYSFTPISGTVSKTGFTAQFYRVADAGIAGSGSQVLWTPSTAVVNNCLVYGN